MGVNVQHSRYSSADHSNFSRKLRENLRSFEQLLRVPGFGEGPTTIGAELELSIIDANGRAQWLNEKLVSAANDSQLTLELNQYNLEYNLSPTPSAGKPFSRIGQEISSKLEHLNNLAKKYDVRAITIGMLPTLLEKDISDDAITDLNRYHILAEALHTLRTGPNRLQIDGLDPLIIKNAGLNAEGANTSFQVHLRTQPSEFADLFNAAQLISAPALAMSTNSPLFMQHRLWEETRIPLFKQLVEIPKNKNANLPGRASMGRNWIKHGAFEIFKQSVNDYPVLIPECLTSAQNQPNRGPELSELRLHHGSIWHWNRAIYDPAENGHLRIELRVLPSGPSIIDMTANAAFILGLTKGLQNRMKKITHVLPFEKMNTNFYRAAQFGMDATLDWPTANNRSLKRIKASTLAKQLLPVAADGLSQLGVTEAEINTLLSCILGRVENKITGARWQLSALAKFEKELPRNDALKQMLIAYLKHSDSKKPVHQWSQV